MFDPAEKETMVSCPFNKSHQILKFRLQTHLVKCSKNYPDLKIKTCTFNSTHVVLESEYQYHLQNCPDRGTLDRFIYREAEPPVLSSKFAKMPNVEIELSENWDNEDCPTYNPEQHCVENNITRQMKVEPPSKKKNFRYEERKRIQRLQEGERPAEESSSQSNLEELIKNSKTMSSAEVPSSNIYEVDKALRSLRGGIEKVVVSGKSKMKINSE